MIARLLASCVLGWASVGSVAAQDVVVIGDSVMAWNEAAAADVIAGATGLDVESRAISGARLTAGPWARITGFEIRAQLGEDRPEIVVMNGGANDFGVECGCVSCGRTLDGLIDGGLDGDLPEFVSDLVRSGSRVIYVGYYDAPVGGNEFSACGRAFDGLHDRVERLAETLPGLDYVTMKDVIDPANAGHFDPDRVHPSAEGSRLLGELVADEILGR